MPSGVYKRTNKNRTGFKKGHKFFGDLSKLNYFQKGDKSFWSGKKLYNKTKEKLSKSHMGKLVREKNPNWKGGISFLKRNALERDNFTCQKCGLKDYDILVIDHIKQKSLYPELKFNLDNLMTLCPNCHARKTLEDIKIRKNIKTII